MSFEKIEKSILAAEIEKALIGTYVYLLTHGEMLSERIASQISEIGQSSSGKAKCEILRKVCFADLCGVSLSVVNLYASQSEDSGSDFGELLKSMESEFLVHVNECSCTVRKQATENKR